MLRSRIAQSIVNPIARATGVRAATFPGKVVQVASRNFAVVTVPLDSLGESITNAVVVTWSKAPGDAIKTDDVVAVVETDKVTMEIRAKKDGKFVEKLCKEGDEIAVGADLYKMDDAAGGSSGSSKSEESSKKESAPAKSDDKGEKKEDKGEKKESSPAKSDSAGGKGERKTVNVPTMGESITQGVIKNWTVKPGDHVPLHGVVAVIETDKVTIDVHSTVEGKLEEFLAKEGDEVDVGKPLFVVSEGVKGNESGKAADKPKAKEEAPKSSDKPAATKADAPKGESKPAAPASGSKPSAPASSKPANFGSRTETRVKMSKMRQKIAERLKESQNTAAMLTTFQEVDMTNLINMRNSNKDEFEKTHGVKLGFMSAFVKSSSCALQELPAVNAVIDDKTKEIVYRNYIDISVAVASPTGLVVPVLRNVENMSFADIEKQIALYGKKAKDQTLALEDMQGGTFTISNGGVFGSLFGTPIINLPQSAILGMHATKPRAVVVDGKVEARPMMYLALTYDHKLIDGREAVTFLKSVQKKIEDPTRMLLEL